MHPAQNNAHREWHFFDKPTVATVEPLKCVKSEEPYQRFGPFKSMIIHLVQSLKCLQMITDLSQLPVNNDKRRQIAWDKQAQFQVASNEWIDWFNLFKTFIATDNKQ